MPLLPLKLNFCLVLDSMLCQKLSRSLQAHSDALKKYTQYSEYVGPDKRKQYEQLEKKALEEGGDALNVYTVSLPQSEL